MDRDRKFTYLLYFNVDYNPDYNLYNNIENIIFLGTNPNPGKLYYNGLNTENANKETKAYILKWLNLVQDNLDEQEKRDLEYAFIYNPKTDFSYNIKDMTLYIKKIKNLN